MSKSFLIDSNVIVYSIDDTSPWHWHARIIIEESKINLYISIQNIAEVYRVITDCRKVLKPLQPDEAKNEILRKIEHFRIIYLNYETIVRVLDLAINKRVVGLDFFDCMLVQVVIENGLDGIITQDDDFANKYNGIIHVIDLQESV